MINTLFWNIRGIAKKSALSRLKILCKQFKLKILALCELKVDASKFQSICLKLGFDCWLHNSQARICVFFKSEFAGSIIFQMDQCLVIKFSHPNIHSEFIAAYVHAACNPEERKSLWHSASGFLSLGLPCILHGDFNVILSSVEKKGGRPFEISEARDMLNFINSADLVDIGYTGNPYTWCNNRSGPARIYKRLDRVLISANWNSLKITPSVAHLARISSDHAPLLVTHKEESSQVKRAFKFQHFWVTQPKFLDIIREAWVLDFECSPLYKINHKLQRTKQALIRWNHTSIGDIFQNLTLLEEEVLKLEEKVQIYNQESDMILLNRKKAQMVLASNNVCEFWRQKAHIKWLRQGDANSRFFHSNVQAKRLRLNISRIKDSSGNWVENPADIAQTGIQYFHKLFSDELEYSQHYFHNLDSILGCIPKIVTEQDNNYLQGCPTFEEVRLAVFELDGESAAGPDGFTGLFFQKSWEIVGLDVHEAVMDFYCGCQIPPEISATLITLIPKKESPQSFMEYRPISLCNFLNKIISKVLALRLVNILPQIISPEQSGFVKGRLISDNVLLAQELIGFLNKEVRGGNVALKLDMAKAYDRISWIFIISVMRKFGFGEKLLDMVWRLISGCNFSILINGAPQGFFPSTRGLRQGDPLSPSLFIIAAEAFSRSLNKLLQNPSFSPFNTSSGCTPITHLSYADDILIFSAGNKRSLNLIMETIRVYEGVSGQLVNVSKSGILLGTKADIHLKKRVGEVTGFIRKSLPVKYLGCPLFLGRKKRSLFSELIENIKAKISQWSSKWLSQGGRIILIKSILYSLPIHLISILHPPKGVLQDLEKLFADFLWGNSDFGTKYHWRRWENLCFPVDEGGIGFRSLHTLAQSFDGKLWYRFRQQKSLWAVFLRERYCKNLHPIQVPKRLKDSHSWKSMLTSRTFVEERMHWEINRGNISLMWDSWLPSGSIGNRFPLPQDYQVSYIIENGEWNFNNLLEIFPSNLVDEITAVPICSSPDEDDRLIWKPSYDGKFSISSMYEDSRPRRSPSPINHMIWGGKIPIKISFFMSNLLQHKLPLDSALIRFGVAGPSRCSCCSSYQVEDFTHLFAEGELANSIWLEFERPLGIGPNVHNWRQRCINMWSVENLVKPLRFCIKLLPSFICWNIWKTRNACRFNGEKPSVFKIISDMLRDLQVLLKLEGFQIGSSQSSWLDYVEFFHPWRKSTRTIQVRWEVPPSGLVKLNTDGSALGTPSQAAGGGILRNSSGNMIFAYYGFLGSYSVIQAEVIALLMGLQICSFLHISNIIIECDCKHLVDIINGERKIPWKIAITVKKIWKFKDMICRAQHCFREANMVADHLAKEGQASKGSSFISDVSCLPQLAKTCMRLDKIGMCNFRTVSRNHMN